jgi:C1A family cysteine protease
MIKPVTVVIDGTSSLFVNYVSGVITSTSCGTTMNHGVLAVGWGTSPSAGPYWIVENSWATTWGQYGYVLIGMSSTVVSGICGINQQVYYPLTI